MPESVAMEPEEVAGVRGLLEAHGTVTLATLGPEGPWAATVFFASDQALNLYFVTDLRTRHGRDMAEGGTVAAAVNRDIHTWDEVLGLQMRGRASVLADDARARALALYLRKFPDVARLFGEPRDAHEEVIADRLRRTAFWCLCPEWVRVVDNRRGFGWKAEYQLR